MNLNSLIDKDTKMSSLRLREILFVLFSLINGSVSLWALDISVELPSGSTIYLDIEKVNIYENQDLYTVSIITNISDPEELQIISSEYVTPMQIKKYFQKDWNFYNLDCQGLFNRMLYPIPIYSLFPEQEDHQTIRFPTFPETPISAFIRFSKPSNCFGKRWHIVPYELGFEKKHISFEDKKHLRDSIEEMVLVLSPIRGELYKKESGNPNLCCSCMTANTLRDNFNGTFTFKVPSEGEFLFNNEGQLIQSVSVAGISSSYEYSDGKLSHICHESNPRISLEYEGKQLISINGLANKIRCEYDAQDFLCRIVDDQGSFIHFSYNEDNSLIKIIDDSGAVLFDMDNEDSTACSLNDIAEGQLGREIFLMFNRRCEIYYYKNPQNIWKFSYKHTPWTEAEEQEI